MKQYLIRSIPAELFFMTMSTLYPSAGYGFLSMSPMIWKNNRDIHSELEKAINDCTDSKEGTINN